MILARVGLKMFRVPFTYGTITVDSFGIQKYEVLISPQSRKRGASPLGGPGPSSGGSRLNHTYGVQAWHSWVQWRNKQLNSASTLGKPSG